MKESISRLVFHIVIMVRSAQEARLFQAIETGIVCPSGNKKASATTLAFFLYFRHYFGSRLRQKMPLNWGGGFFLSPTEAI